MSRATRDPIAPLVESTREEEIAAATDLLARARIAFQVEVLSGTPPLIRVHVHRDQIDESREVLRNGVRHEFEWPEEVDGSTDEEPPARGFPLPAFEAAAGLTLLHVGLVLWAGGSLPWGHDLLALGGLLKGATVDQPWRLLTATFLHVDLSHALRNGIPLIVFAVPLLVGLGRLRAALLYLVAGIGGGLTALYFAEPGVMIVGSSGAIAGLFGAWVVLTLRSAPRAMLGWRTRVRTLGIALLFLPSLINPSTSDGRPVSVSSHMGGLLTGMAVGALLSNRMLSRLETTGRDPDRSWATP